MDRRNFFVSAMGVLLGLLYGKRAGAETPYGYPTVDKTLLVYAKNELEADLIAQGLLDHWSPCLGEMVWPQRIVESTMTKDYPFNRNGVVVKYKISCFVGHEYKQPMGDALWLPEKPAR